MQIRKGTINASAKFVTRKEYQEDDSINWIVLFLRLSVIATMALAGYGLFILFS